MSFDKTLDERQPDTQSAMRPRLRAVGLPETLENLWQEFRRDADPFVFNDDEGFAQRLFATDAHAPSAFRKLDGVGQDVPEDLHEPRPVAVNHDPVIFVETGFELDATHLGQSADGLNSLLDYPIERDGQFLNPHLAAEDSGHVQKIVNQAGQRLRVFLHDSQSAP
jgi:hypothetical protein